MNIPTQLKIGAHLVTVDCSNELDDDAGTSELKTNRIEISAALPQDQKEAALFHELFHFMNTTFSNDPMGHALIDSFAEQLYQILSDNQMLR